MVAKAKTTPEAARKPNPSEIAAGAGTRRVNAVTGISKHTTRLPGWDKRMRAILRELWKRAHAAGDCPTCGKPKGIFKVKKEGPNKGKLFTKCWDHNHFEWVD